MSVVEKIITLLLIGVFLWNMAAGDYVLAAIMAFCTVTFLLICIEAQL